MIQKLTCPHCETAVENHGASVSSSDSDQLTWNGVCARCGRSLFEERSHGTETPPEPFDGRHVGQSALDLLEQTAQEISRAVGSEADDTADFDARATVMTVWGGAMGGNPTLTQKWKTSEPDEAKDQEPEEEFSLTDSDSNLETEPARGQSLSNLHTHLPQTEAFDGDPSSHATFAPDTVSDYPTEPLTGGEASSSRSLAIRSRALDRDQSRPSGDSDYELLDVLGQGGMGVVYKARQASIDRDVAVKMLKTDQATEKQKQSFVSEAVITGELDHPNIVPIYDLGTDDAGALFYSMKRVHGTPWKDVVRQKSLGENLEILMRVADAVAFGHSRGVVHCDLKPENVMLGDFGEVLVMDWGLAQLLQAFRKPNGIARSADGGGTPAYMAPEMATGQVRRIQITSDTYLLGAILFEIITGKPPHTGKSVMDCLVNAAKNKIQPTDKTGELIDIAHQALATDPKDRFANVPAFQAAVRDYQSHSESTRLSDRARQALESARETQTYELFAQALAAYREALSLWAENSAAEEGLTSARFAYAQTAHQKGDYDLGLSLLEADNPAHGELYRRILAAQQERDARQQRLRTTKRLVAALGLLMVTGATAAAFWINEARKEADGQRELAEEQALVAKEQSGIAQRQTRLAQREQQAAERERHKAEDARDDAVRQKSKAEAAKKAADEARQLEVQAKLASQLAERAAVEARKSEAYEAYVARIQLAAAKIDENAFDTARRLLDECRPGAEEPDLRGWEWARLMHLCHQSEQTWALDAPVDAVAFSPDGTRFITAAWDGQARIWDLGTGEQLFALAHQGQYVHAARFSPDGRTIATGSNDPSGFVRLWDAATGRPLKSLNGHTDAVLHVVYSKDGGKLLTSSYDNTARLWDVRTGKELQRFAGHFWWVWSVAFSPNEEQVVTASHDGTAIVWNVATGKKVADFTGHQGPVFAAEFSPDSQTVASGGFDHRVLIWKPSEQPWIDLQQLAAGNQKQKPKFTALDGHTSGVRSLEFSADGRRLLTGADDNALKLWNVETKRPIETLRGHDGWITCCTLSPDGRWALSASQDQQVRLWNLDGYEETRVLNGHVLQGHGDAVLNAAFSRDGRHIATASRDRTARLWSAVSGQSLKTFAEGHSFLSMRAVFSPDGQWLFTAAFDNTVRIWSVAHGTEVAKLEQTGRNAALAVSPDGRYLVTGSDDFAAKVWALDSLTRPETLNQPPEPIYVLQDHRRDVTAVAVSADSRWIYTGDAKGRGRLWNAETGEVRHRWEGHSAAITGAVFLPDGSRVLTASRDQTVAQWDLINGQELRRQILKHPEDVTSLALLSDGRRLLTTCDDKTVRLWNVETATVEKILHTGDDVHTVDVSPDGRLALGLSSVEGLIRIWHLDDGREWTTPTKQNPEAPFFQLASETDSLWSATFSPDNHGLLTVAGNDVRLWSLKTREERMSFNPHGAVASAEFSPDGQWLVTAGWDKTARIWNVNTGRAERKLHGQHTKDINRAVFSPDGRQVLTASDDGTAVLWDAASGLTVRTFRGHKGRVASAVFSADGRWVLTASNDRTARVWNARTGAQLAVLEGHQWAVQSAEFSQEGTRIITAGDDNTARLWLLEIDSHETQTWQTQMQGILKGHSAAVMSAGFSPDGRRVITGSRDDTAIIWDADTGKELLTLKGHVQDVTSARFSTDGLHVLTGSRDGTAIVWLTDKARGQESGTRSQEEK